MHPQAGFLDFMRPSRRPGGNILSNAIDPRLIENVLEKSFPRFDSTATVRPISGGAEVTVILASGAVNLKREVESAFKPLVGKLSGHLGIPVEVKVTDFGPVEGASGDPLATPEYPIYYKLLLRMGQDPSARYVQASAARVAARALALRARGR